jgi:hypothetical protein
MSTDTLLTQRTQARSPNPGSTQPVETTTLNDVHDAIDVIGVLFSKYYALFTAASMVRLEPAIRHDWLVPFREPWIVDAGTNSGTNLNATRNKTEREDRPGCG